MNIARRNHLAPLAVLAALPLLASCSVTVSEDELGKRTEVDIESPVGDLSVRTDVDAGTTGLRVHPGARPLREGREPDTANVSIDSAFLDLEVVAAKFEDDAAPSAIVEYYKQEMAAYGDVTECRGNLDFKGRSGSRQPVCESRPGSREIQLVAGTEGRHRIVGVKPRGSGSEFAIVYIQTHRPG